MREPEEAAPISVATPSDASGGHVRGVSGTERIQLVVRVTDGDGQPVTDAVVEIWHLGEVPAEAAGAPAGVPLSGFGRLATRDDGSCEFDTVRPGRWPGGTGGAQAAHVNVCLFARGLMRHLQTRIYFAGDPALADDPVLALVPADRRGTLLARPDAATGRWVFDVRLQGAQETVFFDA
jgi:protocatechuate 3,4-dioxygenase alpha subunit